MSWPTCTHGYFTTPSHRCPWCFGDDTSKYKHRAEGTAGNGWLLYAEGHQSLACAGCGGPRCAGWGAWAGPDKPTPERVYEQMLTVRFCYSCTRDGKREDATSKKGERLSAHEARCVAKNFCPDCGKVFFVAETCPRLTCGSTFKDGVRVTGAHPNEPPRKTVSIG